MTSLSEGDGGDEVVTRRVNGMLSFRDGLPRGFAFVWQRFDVPGLPAPMLIMAGQNDPRMPAILEDNAWST